MNSILTTLFYTSWHFEEDREAINLWCLWIISSCKYGYFCWWVRDYLSALLSNWVNGSQTDHCALIYLSWRSYCLFQWLDVVVPDIFRWSETFGFFVCLQIPPPLSSRADSATWEWSNLGEHIKNSNISVFLTSFQNPDGLILIQPLLNILLGLTC